MPEAQVVGLLKRADGSTRYLSPGKIFSALNPDEGDVALHNRLLLAPDCLWDYALQENGTLALWPRLIAGGWQHAIPRSNQDFSGLVRVARGRTQEQMCAWFYGNGFKVDPSPKNTGVRVEIHLKGNYAGTYNASDTQTIRNLIQQGGVIKTLHSPAASQTELGEEWAGRGLEFQHPKDRTQAIFNVDLTRDHLGNPEERTGYHIDVKNAALNTKLRIGTQETYQANRLARNEGDPPYRLAVSLPRPHCPATKDFQQKLQQTGLTRSFNSTNPDNPIPEKGMTGGEIGGVACSTSYIEGLFDGPGDLFLDHHFFCFPAAQGGEVPFSDAELQQILRELAIGIYTHNTIPFFSLHFREQGTDLFPVIHPAYENTLVGRVIGMLDYIMKGYLNGGTYQENFIDDWYKRPDWETQSESSLR